MLTHLMFSNNDNTPSHHRPFVPNALEGEELKYKLDMEINQGRAAMLGIFGAMVGEGGERKGM